MATLTTNISTARKCSSRRCCTNGETARAVYLPPGTWIDYQTGKAYAGGWQTIEAGKIPEIILVRDGTVIPHIALAQSTAQMDWSKIELVVYAKDATTAKGLVFPARRKRTAHGTSRIDQVRQQLQTGCRPAGRKSRMENFQPRKTALNMKFEQHNVLLAAALLLRAVCCATPENIPIFPSRFTFPSTSSRALTIRKNSRPTGIASTAS